MPPSDISDPRSARIDLRHDAGTRRPDASRAMGSSVSGIGRFPLRAEPTWDDGGLSQTDGADLLGGAVSDGGRRASGGGGADGNPFRTARGRGDKDRPCFDLDVPENGYAWWYVDGMSADGTRAISIIGFIGSVFSPWYRWSGRKDPANHCCINVATYGPGGRFTMTDRGRSALKVSEDVFRVGPSSMRWDGQELIIDINEIGALPMVTRVRGQVRVKPRAITSVEVPLTPDGAHIWRPFAPISDISVSLEKSGWQWEGHGYFDANFGTRALEEDFGYWTWGRFPTSAGATCFYDATRLDGTTLACAAEFDENGNVRTANLPDNQPMSRNIWTLRRECRADPGERAKQVLPMLDAPFYSRAGVRTRLNGEWTTGVHEALDLTRFRSPWLKPMLAVRVPRRPGWTFSD